MFFTVLRMIVAAAAGMLCHVCVVLQALAVDAAVGCTTHTVEVTCVWCCYQFEYAALVHGTVAAAGKGNQSIGSAVFLHAA
jgi:hypothetical protein